MRKILTTCAALLLVISCGPQKMIEHLELESEGVSLALDVSADREDTRQLNGKLRVVNSGTGMAEYGNFRLFLDADGQQAVTSVKTRTANAQVDTRNIHLSPGDTLHFFVFWKFTQDVNFQRATLKLNYLSAPPESTAPADSTVATP